MQASVERALARYLECRIADPSLTIRLNLAIVDRLGAVVMEGFKAVPRRGLEVGGLLLGHREDGCMCVDDFAPVDSEHQYGPSWLLSEKDKVRLDAEIARIQALPDGPRVIGLYRSQTRAGFAPAAEDRDLMAQHGGADASLFLLIKPEAGGAGHAAWFAADGEGWDHPCEFPFRRRELEGEGHTIVAATALPAVPAPAEPEPPRQPDLIRLRMAKLLQAAAARQPEILPALPPPPKRRRWYGPAAVMLASGLAGYFVAAWLASGRPAAPASPRPLALHVTLDHGSLHLRWDRDSPALRNAAGAVIWIDDAGRERRLDLKPADLTEGSVQYWPTSSDVRFKMELLASPGSAESVRATGIPAQGMAGSRQPALARVAFEALKPRRAGPGFAPARPLHTTVPPDPAGPRQVEVPVNVKVEIDSSGRVSRADLLSRPTPAVQEFEMLALHYSRLWTFSPARSGDRRIPARGILRFRFGNAELAAAREPAGNYSVQKP